MTNRNRAYAIAGTFFNPSHPSYLPLVDLIDLAQKRAVEEERASWTPAVGVDMAVPGSDRTAMVIFHNGQFLTIDQWNAAQAGMHPFPAAVWRGGTLMAVCPRCGTANDTTFCSMCCAPFDYTPTEDHDHGTTEPRRD